ncbi:MAG: hypothetical protein IPH75_12255 [bacterium]|nr:hypothetical protein [bacterium]
MRKFGIWLLIGLLLICNGILLWQTQTLRQELLAVAGPEAYLSLMDGSLTDARGVYTLPTFGQFLMPADSAGRVPPLSLAIFLSTSSNCQTAIMEMDVFKRLAPEFEQRGQRIIAVCAPEDSLAIAQVLDSATLRIPLIPVESEQFSFRQMGISPEFMPFKVLFDSTATAIYMRGSDNTAASQLEFEAAMLRLSALVADGKV